MTQIRLFTIKKRGKLLQQKDTLVPAKLISLYPQPPKSSQGVLIIPLYS
jgi:hypothetical protein